MHKPLNKSTTDSWQLAAGFGANSRLVQIRQRIFQNQIASLFEDHKFQKIKTQVNQNNLTQEESKAIKHKKSLYYANFSLSYARFSCHVFALAHGIENGHVGTILFW